MLAYIYFSNEPEIVRREILCFACFYVFDRALHLDVLSYVRVSSSFLPATSDGPSP